jgi:transposase-like zinc-binding protein
MTRPPLEVADLIRTAGTPFIERNRQWLRWTHIKVLLAIVRCRTAALGGHIDACTRCGYRALAGVLHRVRKPFSGWYALYPVYLVYATWWGYRVWRLNSGSSQDSRC